MTSFYAALETLQGWDAQRKIGLLFLILFGTLSLVSAGTALVALRERTTAGRPRPAPKFAAGLRATWVGAIVFWLAWVSGAAGATLLVALFSFLALREFVTLMQTRRADHRSLMLAFFVVLPVQYVLVERSSFDLFTVFIPVYVFLAIPVLSALGGDPLQFLERNAKIQWGVMVCVFGLSHAPALLLLEFPGVSDRGAFLVFFLVIVTVVAQILEELHQPAPAPPAAGAPCDRPQLRRARLAPGLPRRGRHRRPAVLDHAIQAAAGHGDGLHRRRRGHAGRIRDDGAQARRGRELLGQRARGHRCGGPARSRRGPVLRRAGVLPFGPVVFPGLMVSFVRAASARRTMGAP